MYKMYFLSDDGHRGVTGESGCGLNDIIDNLLNWFLNLAAVATLNTVLKALACRLISQEIKSLLFSMQKPTAKSIKFDYYGSLIYHCKTEL